MLNDENCRTCSDGDKPRLKRTIHPNHSVQKKRINRAKGQLDAIARMIDERRYCPDIIQQTRAARSAIKALEIEIMRTHLMSCVQSAFKSKDTAQQNKKIDEILRLMSMEKA